MKLKPRKGIGQRIAVGVAALSVSLSLFTPTQAFADEETEVQIPTAAQVKAAHDKVVEYAATTWNLDNLGFGAEWVVFGLARGEALTDAQRAAYLDNLKTKIEDADGVLSATAYTEYSRVVIALTALGVDATQFAGYDLTAPLSDEYSKVTGQGVNGSTFALLALDAGGYGTQADRDHYIADILSRQLASGGWNSYGSSSDPDYTAMAVQALAPYYLAGDAAVVAAVDTAIATLSNIQLETGGFKSWGYETSESAGQVINAMAALGIALDDPRFVKSNGTEAFTAWDSLMKFQLANGAFIHVAGTGANGMATEQGAYNLVALYRSLTGATYIYDMSGVTLAAWPEVVPPPATIPTNAAISISGDPIQGEVLTFTATGFEPDSVLQAIVYSNPVDLGTQVADAAGTATWTWTIPADFELGIHRIEITVAQVVGVLFDQFMVTAATLPGGGGTGTGTGTGNTVSVGTSPNASTGGSTASDTAMLWMLAATMCATGGGLALANRRRNKMQEV